MLITPILFLKNCHSMFYYMVRRNYRFWVYLSSALFLLSQILFGEVFVVTSLADSGPGSLREAIETANGTTTNATITFSDGQNEDLDFRDGTARTIFIESTLMITQPLEIQGPGKHLLALDGGGDEDFFMEFGERRVLSLTGSTPTNPHRLLDLTIQNGTSLLGGANIRVIGSLELTRCAILGGRAIAEAPGIMGNSSQNADGGGLFHSGFGSILLIDSCDFSHNGTFGNFSQGGGLYSENGEATIRRSRFYLNTTEGAVSEGGGIGLRSITVMENCEITENETIGPSSGGGGIYTDDEFTAIQSTISGNIVGAATGIMGYSVGGAFANVGFRNASFEHCTIVNNEAPPGAGQGGGISSVSSGTISFFNTILAGNNVDDLERIPNASTRFADLGFNLFGVGFGFSLIPSPQSSSVYGVTSTSTILSDLAFHGGQTRTHRLLDNPSPSLNVIDGGPTRAEWELARDRIFLFEQRGDDFPRVVNGRLDIGAYEFQRVIDSDNDGLPDAVEEIIAGLNPTIADGVADLDQDGICNLDEYHLSGIAAINDNDLRFDLSLAQLPNAGKILLQFTSSSNREYRVRSGTELTQPLQALSADFMTFEQGQQQQPQELQLSAPNPRAFFQIEGQVPDTLREIFE